MRDLFISLLLWMIPFWIPCIISRFGGSINASGADFSGNVAAVERHEIVDGSAEPGRALTAEVASRGSGAVAGWWCSDEKLRTDKEFKCNLKLR